MTYYWCPECNTQVHRDACQRLYDGTMRCGYCGNETDPLKEEEILEQYGYHEIESPDDELSTVYTLEQILQMDEGDKQT